jgi:hypothetical protein
MDLRAIDFEWRNEANSMSEYLSVDVVSREACLDDATLRASRQSLLRQLRKTFGFSKEDRLTFFVDNNRGGKAETHVELLLKHYNRE